MVLLEASLAGLVLCKPQNENKLISKEIQTKTLTTKFQRVRVAAESSPHGSIIRFVEGALRTPTTKLSY